MIEGVLGMWQISSLFMIMYEKIAAVIISFLAITRKSIFTMHLLLIASIIAHKDFTAGLKIVKIDEKLSPAMSFYTLYHIHL